MDLGIAGKTGLVTGASTGIGRGIALALAAEGVRLAIAARRRNLLEEVAGEIAAGGGAQPVVIECDFMQEGALSHENGFSRDEREQGLVSVVPQHPAPLARGKDNTCYFIEC